MLTLWFTVFGFLLVIGALTNQRLVSWWTRATLRACQAAIRIVFVAVSELAGWLHRTAYRRWGWRALVAEAALLLTFWFIALLAVNRMLGAR